MWCGKNKQPPCNQSRERNFPPEWHGSYAATNPGCADPKSAPATNQTPDSILPVSPATSTAVQNSTRSMQGTCKPMWMEVHYQKILVVRRGDSVAPPISL